MNQISRLASKAAGLLLIYVCAHTILEMLLRNFAGTSTIMLSELGGYALAAMTFLPLAETMRTGGLLRVNTFRKLASPRVERVLEVGVVCLALLVVGYLAWFIFGDIRRNFIRGSTTDSYVPVPLWLPPCLPFLGMLLLGGQLVIYLKSLLGNGPLIRDNAPEA
jgi:TRAP-type C4-dicarboxylate transport system permease small subunit